MNAYYPTIGLEIHAELKTNSKMFCGCKNDPDEESPNTNICPVCTAEPGALPVPNKKAIEHVIRTGLAVGGTIADFTEFDRKNYFYPDIPKGYQISQYKYPIVSGGMLADFSLTRIHLEEDTANNKHDRGDYSLIDFNRSGVPLMELVTEPHTFESAENAAKAAGKFAREFQLLLLYLGVSEANMEKGELRVEANISLSNSKEKLNDNRVEVKNLNSFRSAERAIIFELNRMQKLFEEGKESEIVQETRGWNEAKQETFSQRTKENAQDYRYFPEPDIPKFKLHTLFDIEKLKTELPELPEAKRARYRSEYGIKDEDIESYVTDVALGAWFEEVSSILQDKEKVKVASNYVTSDLIGILKKDSPSKMPKALHFAELISMVSDGLLTSRSAKDILLVLTTTEISPNLYAKEKGLLQSTDKDAFKKMVQNVIASNPKVVADYKSGKGASLQFLVGQIMKESKGSANPKVITELLTELLQ